jgi:hypothetical protein
MDTICKRTSATAVHTQRPMSTSAAVLSTYLTAVVNDLKGAAASIKAVTAPAQFAAGQQQMVSDLGTTVNALEQINSKHLADGGWTQALQAASTSPPQVQAAQNFAAQSRAAGLRPCVQIHLGA